MPKQRKPWSGLELYLGQRQHGEAELAHVYASVGRVDEALILLEPLLEQAKTDSSSPPC